MSNNDEDWEVARYLRNSANNAVKAAKANYVKNELDNTRADPKKFWMNIKNVLPDSSAGNINIVDSVSRNALPKSQQAQEINDFFASIGRKLDSKFKEPVVLDEVLFNGEPLEIDPISQVEVLGLVRHISVYKSSGMDNVSSRVLKDFLTLASREVTLLYNRVIQSGVFPDKWKIATVTPIPKVQNAEDPTDLRPISLLPIPGKLIERYITKQITDFLENQEFFTDNQFGFRKSKSTVAALTTILDDVISQLNNMEYSLVAYLDFKKAFDTINHKILINKLEKAGLGPNLIALIKNYLSGRKQKTKLFSEVSTLKPVEIGVPQGSTIGPLMFIVYINDLDTVLQKCNHCMYADDTVLYCSNASRKLVRKNLQMDVDRVQKWCDANRLTLNVTKTKVMSFMSDHRRKHCNKFKIYMKGTLIDEVENYKYLGTTLDNRLNGDPQYNKLLRSVGYKLATFSKIRKYLNTRAALTVYKSTILPIIDYNDYFQFLWNAEKTRKLQKIQNWGLRISLSGQRFNEIEMHSSARLDLLEIRRICHLLSVMYYRSKDARYLDGRRLPTRQFDKIKFKVINPGVKKAFKSPNYLGSRLWDLLPRDTQASPTIHQFKAKIAHHVEDGLFTDFKI